MNLLVALVRWPLSKSLGWALWHFLWEGAAIALVLAMALWLWGRSPRVRYGLGCAALLAMPVAFGVTLALSRPAVVAGANAAVAARVDPGVELGTGGLETRRSMGERLRQSLPWAVPFWMAGVLLFYMRSAASWVAVQRLRRKGVCAAAEEWRGRLTRLSERMRVKGPVMLLESCLVDVPVVIGMLRPAILMPVGLMAGLSTEQVECLLLHELAHIARRDYLVNVLQSVVEGLLFYHPAVWWISGLVRTERENCCDDAVVRVKGDRRGYAAALAKVESSRWTAREHALAANGGGLMKRIHRLLHGVEPRPAAQAPLWAAGVLLAGLGVAAGFAATEWQGKPAAAAKREAPTAAATGSAGEAPAVSARPLVAQAAPARKQGPEGSVEPRNVLRFPLATPYLKWMNEDAAYIITDAERAAFRALTSDAEREIFITDFWKRRDPTPDSMENEFKEEHYRRIAYANQRFAAGIPGWKTDRGRIYITYGPADAIESHPSGGNYRRPAEQGGTTVTTVPFEQWMYRYIEGVGKDVIVEFVDPTRSGEYRMTMDPNEKEAAVAMNLPRDVPGGKAGASVRAVGSTAALVSIPLSAYGSHAVKVEVRVVTAARQPVTSFEQEVQGPVPAFSKFLPLPAGSYRLVVVVKDMATGLAVGDDVGFEVK